MDTLRREKLERAFNPRVVAVVGDKGPNYTWLRSVRDVQAKVYSVQIDPNEIPGILEMGYPNVSSLKEIPEPIDYVICAVPRPVTPRIVQDAIDLDVGAVGMYTAGFAETGEEEGIRLQERLTQMSQEAGLNLVGPNCMCLYHGKSGLRTGGGDQRIGEGGRVSVIAQSGRQTGTIIGRAWASGIPVNKGISMGNGIALDQADWVDYLGEDPETEAIVMYIEGVRDGRKFFRVLRDVAPRKPVLIWKGGRNAQGFRASASHTGSMAIPLAIWDAMMRQAGAIRVDGEEEVVDTLKAVRFVKPITGDRLGLIAATGGQSVAFADAFGQAGFLVPPLAPHTIEKLSAIGTLIGGSYRNPLDMTGAFISLERTREILDLLAGDENIDAIAFEVSLRLVTQLRTRAGADQGDLARTLREFQEASPKPLLAVTSWAAEETARLELHHALNEAGIPAFDSFQQAANALRKVVDYHRAHAKE